MFKIDDLWKIFRVVKGEEVTDITEILEALAKSEKTKSENFFNTTMDQFTFSSDDYTRLKSFLIDWYAALKTITASQDTVSDPFSIPDSHLDELFRSFGFDHSVRLSVPDNKVNENKVNLFLDLVNLYKIKGSPRSIFELLQYYKLNNIDIYEFWLEKATDTSLHFKGQYVIGNSNNKTVHYFPFSSIVANDPHWILTESQILELDRTNKINLPSKSPYFAIRPNYELKVIPPILARTCQDQYDEFISTGSIIDDTALISELGENFSLLELYLSCIYIFNELYDTGKSGPTIFKCYDGTNVVYTDIIAEHNALTSTPPTSKEDRDAKLIQYYDLFTRPETSNFLQNKDTAKTLLNTINPTLYTQINTFYESQPSDTLSSLLRDLGDWIEKEISEDFTNMAYLVLGMNSFSEDFGEVIDFFKPYRSRLIDFELIDVENKLAGSIRVGDDSDENVFDTIVDHLTGGSVGCCPGYQIEIDTTSVSYMDGTTLVIIDETSQTNILTCTSDSTSGVSLEPRLTYDCGSYYDIGAVDDDDCEIYYQDLYYDGLFCFPDGTSNINTYHVLDSTGTWFITQLDGTSQIEVDKISLVVQETGKDVFDGDGVFDCLAGSDQCHIVVENV